MHCKSATLHDVRASTPRLATLSPLSAAASAAAVATTAAEEEQAGGRRPNIKSQWGLSVSLSASPESCKNLFPIRGARPLLFFF